MVILVGSRLHWHHWEEGRLLSGVSKSHLDWFVLFTKNLSHVEMADGFESFLPVGIGDEARAFETCPLFVHVELHDVPMLSKDVA